MINITDDEHKILCDILCDIASRHHKDASFCIHLPIADVLITLK